MKSIINNKLYNTETAEKIAEWDNGLGSGDFNSLEKTIYQTKKGAFLVKIDGGANTQYCKYNGNMSHGSTVIHLLTDEETFNLLVQFDQIDLAIELFPNNFEIG